MAGLKKSIYLDEDVDLAVRQSAEADGRSFTKQLNVLLRNALGQQQANRRVASAPPVSADLRLVHPDPKIKSAKKLK